MQVVIVLIKIFPTEKRTQNQNQNQSSMKKKYLINSVK